jgi:hypothetical protein
VSRAPSETLAITKEGAPGARWARPLLVQLGTLGGPERLLAETLVFFADRAPLAGDVTCRQIDPGEANSFRSRLYGLYPLVPDGDRSETRVPHRDSLTPAQREAEREACEDFLIEQECEPALSYGGRAGDC